MDEWKKYWCTVQWVIALFFFCSPVPSSTRLPAKKRSRDNSPSPVEQVSADITPAVASETRENLAMGTNAPKRARKNRRGAEKLAQTSVCEEHVAGVVTRRRTRNQTKNSWMRNIVILWCFALPLKYGLPLLVTPWNKGVVCSIGLHSWMVDVKRNWGM